MPPLILNSNTPVSPPESGFVPRREFIRDPTVTRHTFALVAMAGSNLVRLFSFPDFVVRALREALAQQELFKYYREDVLQHMCEFTIHGKPWATSKAFATEKLLVDIITLICQCGFNYLSTIDYGREQDDRLTIAFATPVAANNPSSLPGTPQLGTPLVDGATLNADKSSSLRLPFALSFVSATVLRVISPPLHSTPAILQAVRGSWPRGVVSEKKVGANSYEFKLKGYSLFQQDTFAADSLRYILSLLSTLDHHSFALVTSLSLTNRSRVKDLWVFTCHTPVNSENSVPPSILNTSDPDIRRRRMSNEPGQGFSSSSHRRAASEMSPPHASSHQRSYSDVNHQRRGSRTYPAYARYHEPDSFTRAKLPSTVSSSIENMTGVGSGPQQSPVSPKNVGEGPDTTSDAIDNTVGTNERPLSNLPVSSPSDSFSNQENQSHPPLATRSQTWSSVADSEGNAVPPLLGPGAFRDSAISTGTEEQSRASSERGDRSFKRSDRLVIVSGVPGGWQPSPIEESTEEEALSPLSPLSSVQKSPLVGIMPELEEPSVHQVESRHDSPALKAADQGLRRSEAGVIVEPSPLSSVPPLPPISPMQLPQASPSKHMRSGPSPHRSQPTRGRSKEARNGGSHGWVLVNVERPASPGTDSTEHRGVNSRNTSPRQGPGRPPEGQLGAIPQSRIIAAADAQSNSQGVKRGLSLTRKNTGKLKESPTSRTISPESSSKDNTDKSRPGFFDRLQHLGTPQASRNERKRQLLD